MTNVITRFNPPAARVEVLTEALGYLRELGWTQGTVQVGYRPGAPVCAGGAIQCALSHSDNASIYTEGSYELLRDVMKDVYEMVTCPLPLPLWNDQPGRTEEEVIIAFEQIIANLKDGGGSDSGGG